MTNYDKAAIIADTLNRIGHFWLTPEDILSRATPKELDYYARWCRPL